MASDEVSAEARKQVATLKAEFLEAAIAEDRERISRQHVVLMFRSFQAMIIGILIAVVDGIPAIIYEIPMLIILAIKIRPNLRDFQETIEKIMGPWVSPDPKVVGYIRRSFWKPWWRKHE